MNTEDGTEQRAEDGERNGQKDVMLNAERQEDMRAGRHRKGGREKEQRSLRCEFTCT